jgi:hypothetical protein
MKHILIVYGRNGKMRKNTPKYIPEWIAKKIKGWFVEVYLGKGPFPFPEEMK